MLGFYGYTMWLTYLNIVSALVGMVFALDGNIGIAIVCLISSGVCDLFDGLVARTKKNRSETEKGYGIEVDSLADVVSFGVFPAVIAYSLGLREWWHFAVMIAYVLFALIRLSYFNTTEVELQKQGIKRTHYTGLPVTTAALIYPILYLAVDSGRLPLAFIITMLVMSLLFVLKIKVPKFKPDEAFMRFLYTTGFGRVLLKLLVAVFITRFVGWLMDSGISSLFIEGFIKNNDIDMSQYKRVEYKSFNDFFTREIADGCRPFPEDLNKLAAPCDGKLSAYHITEESFFKIKRSIYDVHTLLKNNELADEYMGGTCLIFRLTPDDYHRYNFIDDGEILEHKKIKGIFHTVRPFAIKRYKVFLQNAREYTVMQTEHFGKVVQIEVGAMFVGRIVNHRQSGSFKRAEEKGMFEFGGSTVMLLFKKDEIRLNDALFTDSENGENGENGEREVVVRLGEAIGQVKS